MARKQRLGTEEKINIVRRCLKGEVGIREAGRMVGVANETIRRWIARYETGGIEELVSPGHNRVYSPELKKQAVQEYLSGGNSLLEVTKKYKLRNDYQLRQWIKVYNAHEDFSSIKLSGGGSYMKQGRTTTLEERVQIVRECIASGRNYGEMALKYQVSYQQVRIIPEEK